MIGVTSAHKVIANNKMMCYTYYEQYTKDSVVLNFLVGYMKRCYGRCRMYDCCNSIYGRYGGAPAKSIWNEGLLRQLQ